MAFRRIRLAALVCAVALLAGCGSDSSTGDSAPAPAVSTTAPTDPYAIPAVIDEAYVEKVLAALEEIRAEVRREVVQTKSFSQLSRDRLHDIYDEPALSYQLQVFSDASMGPNDDTRPNPGVVVETVHRLYSARSDCIAADTISDASAVVFGESNLKPRSVVLMRSSSSSRWNPTPWRMVTDGGTPIAERGDPCA